MNAVCYYKSPLGILKIVEEKQYITKIEVVDVGGKEKKTKILEECKKQLEEYFSGNREVFSVPILINGTNFQKKVWNQLLKIPYGETRSYSDIGEMIGSPNGSRAVGNANNKNPIMIIIPCHRVIGKNGKLVGYRGGIEKKEILLNIENR